MAEDAQKAEETLSMDNFIQDEIAPEDNDEQQGIEMDFPESTLTPALILDEINKIREAPAEYALENFEDDEEIDEDLME